MASQLSSDDFRNVGQALMHNSLDILSAIKHLRFDPRLRRLLPERVSRIEWREDMRSEFSSRLDVGVLGVHPRAEVAEERRALRR